MESSLGGEYVPSITCCAHAIIPCSKYDSKRLNNVGLKTHIFPTVVQLIDFCFEGPKRALIYEYMPNGSLEKHIFPKEGAEKENGTLGWEKMYEISYMVATGIDYLH